jgi:hypothetical protein
MTKGNPVRATKFFLVTGAAAVTLGAALGGCQGGGARAASARAETPKSRVAPERPSTPPAAPTRACTTADLSVVPAQHEEQDGLQIERFTVSTAAAPGCTLTGPPNLVPKGPLSAQVPGATVDLAVSQLPVPTSVGLAAGNGGTVPLPPGKTASFYLAWYDASTVVCVQSNGFGFNAPGDTTYTDLKAVPYPVGSLCDGIFYVSPVF